MSKVTDKPSVEEPAADQPSEESHVDRLLRLPKESTSRRGTLEADRMARIVHARGWTREELYKRGTPQAD